MGKRVHFGSDKPKITRLEAIIEAADPSVSALTYVVAMMLIWRSNPNIGKLSHFIFSIDIVLILILSIIKPLWIIKRHNLQILVSISICATQATAIGMALWVCTDCSTVVFMASSIIRIEGVSPSNICICKVVAIVVLLARYQFDWPLKLSICLTSFDVGHRYIIWWVKRRRIMANNYQKPGFKEVAVTLETQEILKSSARSDQQLIYKPGRGSSKKIENQVDSSSFTNQERIEFTVSQDPSAACKSGPSSKIIIRCPEELNKIEEYRHKLTPCATMPPTTLIGEYGQTKIEAQPKFSSDVEKRNADIEAVPKKASSKEQFIGGHSSTPKDIEDYFNESELGESPRKIHTMTPKLIPRYLPKTLPPIEITASNSFQRSVNLHGMSNIAEQTKVRVFSEYLSMIEDLVLVVDKYFNLIANNYNSKTAGSVINKLKKRVDRVQLSRPGALLTDLFCHLENDHTDHIKCNPDTVNSLITLYTCMEYKKYKMDPEKKSEYEAKKIDKILNTIEMLENGIKLSSKLSKGQPKVKPQMASGSSSGSTQSQSKIIKSTGLIGATSGTFKKLTSCLRAINLKKDELLNCDFGIIDFLYLIREYLQGLEQGNLRFHFSQDLVFGFYFPENVFMKVRLVRLDGKYYLIILFENIQEKMRLGHVNAKLNYSFMLTNSLTHELFTPIHQILSYSDTLIAEMGQPAIDREKLKESMTAIKQIASGLFLSIKNMMDYASIINHSFKLEKSRFLIKDVFTQLDSSISIKAKKKEIELRYRCDPHLEIFSDPQRLAGLLLIFLENSIKFTEKGGILLCAETDKHKVVFKIIDTGRGISADDLSKISQILHNPFLEEKTQFSAGLGIGYRIAQHLYKKLTTGDQIIEIKSMEGVGTTIQFEIVQGFDKDRIGGRCSPSASYKSKQSEVMLDANIDLDAAKRTEFQTERNFLLQGVAKLMTHTLSKPQSLFIDLDQHATTPGKTSPLAIKSPTELEIIKEEKSSIALASNGSATPQNLNTFSNMVNARQKESSSKSWGELYETPKARYLKKGTKSPNRNPISPINMQTVPKKITEENLSEDNVIAEVVPLRSQKSEEASVPKPKRFALVVDDDSLNCDAAVMMLCVMEFDAVAKYSGQACIELCEQYLKDGKKIDIIFMDFNMPGLQGDETTRILREPRFDPILKGVPIVGLTAHHDDETRLACISAGMDRVEHKPFSFIKLKTIVKSYNLE